VVDVSKYYLLGDHVFVPLQDSLCNSYNDDDDDDDDVQ